MATNQKKRTSTGRAAKRPVKKSKPGKAASSKKTQPSGEQYQNAFVLVCVVAFMLFIACCNVGLCGAVGRILQGILFGLFGIVQYVLPFMIIIAAFVLVSEQYSSYIIRKLTLSSVMVLLICALCHMIVHIEWGFDELGQSYLYSQQHQSAGGIVGAFITSLFYPLLDKSGTYLLVILAMIILFLFIAGNVVFDIFRGWMLFLREDEEEMVARRTYQEKRKERIFAKQQARKTARKQYYEQAARKEEDALTKFQMHREQTMQIGDVRSPENMDLYHSLQVLPPDKTVKCGENGKKKAKRILTEEGFVTSDTMTDTAKPLKKQDVKSVTKESEMRKAEPVKTSVPVKITSDGELKITGMLDNEEEKAEQAGFSDVALHADTVLETSSAKVSDPITLHPVKEPIVEKTTALFVNEEDLETVSTEKEKTEVSPEPASGGMHTDNSKLEPGKMPEITQKRDKEEPKTDRSQYTFPLKELLSKGKKGSGNSKAELQATAQKLEDTLNSFGVHVTVTNVSCGPAVTRYEMLPEQGTRVNKITGLADDIKLSLAVADIRMEAPIPGKSAIGVEVPNKEATAVAFRDLLEQSDFMQQKSDLSFAVGKDIGGKVVICDIAKMPHLLIAGATGSGKSVCINTLIMSILYKAHPDDVKLIMIDPKVVELSVYNGIPHLLIPVVTDPKKASGALNWAVAEMEARYKKFAEYNVRNLEGYNQKIALMEKKGEFDNEEQKPEKMPKIVIIVDELADLMMVAHGEVEDAIVRLSQLARAAGIHLVIATQRPSVDVITGLIKANVPSRIAFAVSSGVDSRTILDMNGAEKLLGKGDMLFAPSSYPKPVRVQGAFISDREVSKVVEFLKAQNLKIQYNDNITREINCGPQSVRDANKSQELDEYFVDAGKFVIEKEKASITMIQRVYKVGFNRAARIMDQLTQAGVVSPEEGTKPRQILMSMQEFEDYLSKGL